MSNQAYPAPVLINDKTAVALERIRLDKDVQFQYNEAWLQNFLFENYLAVPFGEIDRTYNRVVPVCRELNTPAGPIDVLYVTPEGKLVVLEAKLWRNPEARRKVVAQILDYAKELSRWRYEDLQREVSRSTGIRGNALYELVKSQYSDIDEAPFIDEVTRSLAKGDFLLLIVGDGISEGTRNITEFMQTIGRLQFTLGLVEVALYRMPDQNILVQPRILAKTTIIERAVLDIRHTDIKVSEPEEVEIEEAVSKDKEFYTHFWREFVKQLQLDDVSIPMSDNASAQNFYLYPGVSKNSWISAYFAGSKGRIGVYFRVPKGDYGMRLYEFLKSNEHEIISQLGNGVAWDDEGTGKAKYLYIRMDVDDIKAPKNKVAITDFFNKNVNNFVNVLRPLLKTVEQQI